MSSCPPPLDTSGHLKRPLLRGSFLHGSGHSLPPHLPVNNHPIFTSTRDDAIHLPSTRVLSVPRCRDSYPLNTVPRVALSTSLASGMNAGPRCLCTPIFFWVWLAESPNNVQTTHICRTLDHYKRSQTLLSLRRRRVAISIFQIKNPSRHSRHG